MTEQMSIEDRLIGRIVASCTCGTKSADADEHRLDCTYRVLWDALGEIQELRRDKELNDATNEITIQDQRELIARQRRLILAIGRGLGAGLSDDVSLEFLEKLPGEAEAVKDRADTQQVEAIRFRALLRDVSADLQRMVNRTDDADEVVESAMKVLRREVW